MDTAHPSAGCRYAGKGIANPVANFWKGAMMLEHLGENAAAEKLMRAVEASRSIRPTQQ